MQALTTMVATLSVVALSPAQDLQAALVALEPIEASWVNAPTGTPGTTVTHPSGLLTTADVQAPAGSNWARFQCALVQSGGAWTVTANSSVSPPPPQSVETHADLLLVAWAPSTMVAAIEVEVRHLGDWPDSNGFRVDIDADGSYEADTGFNHITWRHYATHDFGDGVLVVRLRSDCVYSYTPQSFELTARIVPWDAAGQPAGSGCLENAFVQDITGPVFATNYQLALFEAAPAGSGLRLTARGLGPFSLFFISPEASTVPLQLPPPFAGTCPVLANVVLAASGTPIGTAPVSPPTPFTDWQLLLPPLPPGMTLYVQHGSANDVAPWHFGTTNVIRIDT